MGLARGVSPFTLSVRHVVPVARRLRRPEGLAWGLVVSGSETILQGVGPRGEQEEFTGAFRLV